MQFYEKGILKVYFGCYWLFGEVLQTNDKVKKEAADLQAEIERIRMSSEIQSYKVGKATCF